MKNNSIVTNLQQDLNSSEQIQARKNIDAAKTIYLTNPATGFGGDLTFNYSLNAARYEVSVGDTKVGIMPSIPTEPDQILCTDASGRLVWDDNNAQPLNCTLRWDEDSTNTVVLDPTGKGYIQCPYTKFLFSCQVYCYDEGRYAHDLSFCPVNSIGEYYAQPTLPESGRPYTAHLSTTDDTSLDRNKNWTTISCMWNHPDIRYIAIKGNSIWTSNTYYFDIQNITMVELP